MRRYPLGTQAPARTTDPGDEEELALKETNDEQLTSDASELIEWAKLHGPPEIASSAEQGRYVKVAVLSFLAYRLAQSWAETVACVVTGGTELARTFRIRARKAPSEAALSERERIRRELAQARAELHLPEGVTTTVSPVVRIEEGDRRKYTGVLVTIEHRSTMPRYIIHDFE